MKKSESRLAPLNVNPELLASARRLIRAERSCHEQIAQAARLAKNWTLKTALMLILFPLLASCNDDRSAPTLPDKVILVVIDNELESTIVYTEIEFFIATPGSIEIVGRSRELDMIGFQVYGSYDACSVQSVIVFPESLQPADMICEEV